jgi:hypothetical protein
MKGLNVTQLTKRESKSRVNKQKFISTLKNQVSLKKSNELDYSSFIEKGYLKHESEKVYNKVLADSTPMAEDLPVFALDLYNMYLHNLESTDPIKLQK